MGKEIITGDISDNNIDSYKYALFIKKNEIVNLKVDIVNEFGVVVNNDIMNDNNTIILTLKNETVQTIDEINVKQQDNSIVVSWDTNSIKYLNYCILYKYVKNNLNWDLVLKQK